MSFGGGSGSSSSISGSTDVTISTPANNEVLGYNSGTAKWQNQTKTTGPCFTSDPGALKAAATTFPAANRTYYMRVHGEITGATAYVIWVGNSSGNISIANYANTGTGVNAAPTGAPRGVTGSVACPATGAQLVFASGGAFSVAEGDWIGLSCDNATASFGSRMDSAPTVLYAGVCCANNVFPAGTPSSPYTATTPFFVAAEFAVAGGGTAPSFTASTPPNATQGVAYSYQFTATGSPVPTFAVTTSGNPGSLALGLTLSSGGLLSGTPTTLGTATFTIAASNGVSPNAAVTNTMTVSAATGGAPVFTASTPPGGTVSVAYSYQYTASGTTPIAFAVTSGSLPAGVTLTSGGLLGGTPTTAATSSFTVTASNGVSPNATAGQSITVATSGGGFAQWVADFQTGDFSQWPQREFKDNATSADQARQQQILTSPARPGYQYSARFDVISTDQTSGDPSRNRSEVADYTDISGLNGGTSWWGWSMFVPTGFHVDTDAESPVGNGWLICTQWHSAGGSPPCVIGMTKPADHIPHLLISATSSEWDIATALPLGVWNDFKVGITFSQGTGHLTVKMSSAGGAWSTLVDADCTTLDSSGVAYFKQGLYRAMSYQDQFIYLTGTRRGATEASVAL